MKKPRQKILGRRNRERDEEIRRRFNRLIPHFDGDLIEHRNGFGVRRRLHDHLHPFFPTVRPSPGSTTFELVIEPGWVKGPYVASTVTDDAHEIPTNHLKSFMPEIAGVALNATTRPTLTLAKGETNYVYLTVTLSERIALMGDSSVLIGASTYDGMITYVDDHDHAGSATAESPVAIAPRAQLCYHINTSQMPTFNINTTGVPADTKLVHNVEFFEIVVGDDGTVDEPYSENFKVFEDCHYKHPVPTYVRSNATGEDTANPTVVV